MWAAGREDVRVAGLIAVDGLMGKADTDYGAGAGCDVRPRRSEGGLGRRRSAGATRPFSVASDWRRRTESTAACRRARPRIERPHDGIRDDSRGDHSLRQAPLGEAGRNMQALVSPWQASDVGEPVSGDVVVADQCSSDATPNSARMNSSRAR